MTDCKQLIAELCTALEWYVSEDETYRGDNSDEGGKNWDEINAYWIEGQDKALAAIAKAKQALLTQ
jgi:hypothetical protein